MSSSRLNCIVCVVFVLLFRSFSTQETSIAEDDNTLDSTTYHHTTTSRTTTESTTYYYTAWSNSKNSTDSTTYSTITSTTTTTTTSPDIPPTDDSSPDIPLTCPWETEVLFPNLNLTFPETPVNSWAIPEELCLQSDYSPVRRYCLESGIWSKTIGNRCEEDIVTNTTKLLHDLTKTDVVTAIDNITIIMRNKTDEIMPMDVHLISTIIDRASRNQHLNSSNFFQIINDLIKVDKRTLRSSQESLNSTDGILNSLDQYILSNSSNISVAFPRLLIEAINSTDKVVGAMFIKNGNSNDFTSFQKIDLHIDNYKEILNSRNFEIAVIIPQARIERRNDYFVTLFPDESLFNEINVTSNLETSNSLIISILIPNQTKIKDIIKIYFKESRTTKNQTCNHWNYGFDGNIAITGNWKFDNKTEEFKNGYYICSVNHTTHFGMLISDELPDSFVLDLLTIFGSVLSIFGIAVLLVTAILFKTWRSNPSNKIIINLSICLLLLIILFFISDRIQASNFCIFIGILLHYIVIAQFCWSLAISYSNYRRLYMNLHYHINNVVIKYCTFAWGLPLVVVLVNTAINYETYNKTEATQFCYPKKHYLLWSLFCPVAVILFINSMIYIAIIKKLLTTGFDMRKHKRTRSFAKEKMIFLMFFIMGLTWIFGIFAAINRSTLVFAYLFCTIATSHGFAVFVFYVLDQKDVRELWKKKINVISRIRHRKFVTRQNNSSDTVVSSIAK